MKVLFIDLLVKLDAAGLNLGICYLSAHLRESGHQVGLLDIVNIRTGPIEDRVRRAVESYHPDLVGIPVFNMSYEQTKEHINNLRKYYRGKIVVGGPEITGLGAKSLEDIHGADFAILGEAEITLVELVDALDGKNGEKKELKEIAGLVWRDGEGIIENVPRANNNNVDELLFPDFEIYGLQGMDIYPVCTSRGCPHSCSFCFNPDKEWRARSPENIIEEIKEAKARYNIKLFHIVDSSFNMRLDRISSFCDLLIEENVNLPWFVEGFRADRVSEEILEKMYRAKCRRIWIGVESMNEEVFAGINKSETLDEIIECVKMMRKYDWELFGYMIIGLPGDTLERTLASFEKTQQLGFDLLSYSMATPETGTPLEAWAIAKANILTGSHSVSSIGDNDDEVPYETPEFTADERRLARKIINTKLGSYYERGVNPNILRVKKWFLTLRYDAKNIFRHFGRSLHYRLVYNRGENRINVSKGLYLARIPDGTWCLGRDDHVQRVEGPTFIDMRKVAHSALSM